MNTAQAQQATVVTIGHEVKPISVSLLENLVLETISSQANEGETRMSHFLQAVAVTDEGTFKTAIGDFRKAHKDNKSMTVRASELQAMYFARLHGCELEGLGYGAAINAARAFLKEKNLRANGKPILSEDEQQANRDKNFARKVREEVNATFDWSQEGAAAKFEEAFQAKAAEMQGEAEQKALEKQIEALDAAIKVVLDKGLDYAVQFQSRLAAAINAIDPAAVE